jgi:hypothetical protein
VALGEWLETADWCPARCLLELVFVSAHLEWFWGDARQHVAHLTHEPAREAAHDTCQGPWASFIVAGADTWCIGAAAQNMGIDYEEAMETIHVIKLDGEVRSLY